MSTPAQNGPSPSYKHYELFVVSRSQETVRIPCWCSIGASHTYRDWLDAGRPDTAEPADADSSRSRGSRSDSSSPKGARSIASLAHAGSTRPVQGRRR